MSDKNPYTINQIFKYKNIISFLLCIVVIVLIVGCSTTDSSKLPDVSSSVQEKDQEKDQKKDSDSPQVEKPIKLNLLIGAATNMPATDQDIILKELKEQLLEHDIDIEVNALAEYGTQLNVRIAGGNIPDMFGAGKLDYVEYAKQGILLQLDPYLDEIPSIATNYTEDITTQSTIDGKTFGISKRPYVNYGLLYVRKDWLDNLNLDIPTTLDEFYDVAVAFREEDPDGNGKKDTYGYTTGYGMLGFAPIFGAYGTTVPSYIYEEDNTLKYSTAEPLFKEALGYIKKLIESDAVDPEFLANDAEVGRQKMFMGQAGMAFFQWSELTKPPFGEQMKATDPDAEWIYIDPLEGPGGQYLTSSSKAVGSFLCFSSALEKDDAKLSAALKFADLLIEGPIHDLVCYGIEDEHYKIEGDKIIALPEMGDVSYSHSYQLTGRNEIEYLMAKYPMCEDEITYAATAPMINRLNGYIINPEGFNYGDLSKYEQEEVIKFIYGEKDIAEFDKFLDTCYSTYNLSLYLEEAERQLKEIGVIK